MDSRCAEVDRAFKLFQLADERAQVGCYRTVEAFADLVPIGILGGESLSGMVPVLVVNSLLVPSVLSTPQASEDPLKSILPILMSRGSARRFVAFASENTGPAPRNYPHHSLALDGGGGHHSSSFPTSPSSPCCPYSLFDLAIKSFPVFMSDVYPGAAWEMAG